MRKNSSEDEASISSRLGFGNIHIFTDLLEKIEPILKSQSVALIDVDWLISFKGIRVPCRQGLPQDAFISLTDLSFGFDSVIVLSYMWQSIEHPDPDGCTLRLLQRALRLYKNGETISRDDRLGIFWDFCSLHQNPRTPEEENLFREGLEGISYLYMHPDSVVMQISKFPSAVSPEARKNAVAYMKRGWPFTEFCWASVVKEGWTDNPKLLDLSRLDESRVETFQDFVAACGMKIGQKPLVPERFDEMADTLSFTNGKDDRLLVKRLYRQSFIDLFKRAKSLTYEDLEWTDDDAEHLIDVVRGGYAPLRFLNISGNQLGPGFCSSFSSLITETQLVVLDLSENHIGDDGVGILALHLVRMKRVSLVRVGMTDAGCGLLVNSVGSGGARLNHLDISSNHIELGKDLIRLVCTLKPLHELCVRHNPLVSHQGSLQALIKICKSRHVDLSFDHGLVVA